MTALFGLEQDMSTWGEVYSLPASLLHTHTRAHYVLLTEKFSRIFQGQNSPNLCCIVNSWRLQYKAIVPAIAFELNLKQMVDQVFFIIFYLLFFIYRDPWFCTCEGGRQTKGQRQSQTRPQRKRQIHGQYQEKIEKQGKRLDTNTKAWTNTRPLYL